MKAAGIWVLYIIVLNLVLVTYYRQASGYFGVRFRGKWGYHLLSKKNWKGAEPDISDWKPEGYFVSLNGIQRVTKFEIYRVGMGIFLESVDTIHFPK